MEGHPQVSVIVMSYRNRGTIERVVRSVLDQDTSRPYEVIVVASGDDGAGDIVSTRFPEVRVLVVPERLSPGAVRNKGVALARADVIAFLAADCVADRNWIEARLDAHDQGHAAVAGAVTNGGSGAWSHAGHYALFASRLPGWPSREVSFPQAAAHSLSYRRDLLATLGPFPDDFAVAEDTEMARRLMEAGIPIWFDSRVRIAHLGNEGRTVLDDQRRRGRRLAAEEGLRISPTSRVLAAAKFTQLAFNRCRWVTRSTWRGAKGARWRLVSVLPLLWTCAISYQIGWFKQQLLLRSAPAQDEDRARLHTAVQAEREVLKRLDRVKRKRQEAPPVAPTDDRRSRKMG